MTNILLLSENTELKSEISKYLLEDDYTVVESNAHLSGQLVFNKINLIIFDATSSKNETASFVSQLKTHNPLILIIVVVDDGNVQIAVQSIRAGAIDALALPLDKQKFLSKKEFHKNLVSTKSKLPFNKRLIFFNPFAGSPFSPMKRFRSLKLRRHQPLLSTMERCTLENYSSIPSNQKHIIKMPQ